MKFAPIINPDACRPGPKPVRVDLRKTFLIGTSIWCVALIASAILLFLDFPVLRLLIVCAAGTVIGVMMLIWEHFDRWDYRRLGV
ncbi:hypothetical protein DSM100688_1162 [Bifidobacterium ramosum]|uniref:DUF2530 domain-containing protein n=1 Tax=Bifidobacterium ramosum TaxID=1798158 RepID=A0A6L4X049_9BIFI|nr:hypothetical protein [Bifidobacterium ramosum]KAB8288052.1 hypothetical protein DSM100688_1162 [Bifidobacterium ramosum]NEG72108.1 hypothetical protein [Bifidobacterium ramosum]